jgi:hypothetical protein
LRGRGKRGEAGSIEIIAKRWAKGIRKHKGIGYMV